MKILKYKYIGQKIFLAFLFFFPRSPLVHQPLAALGSMFYHATSASIMISGWNREAFPSIICESIRYQMPQITLFARIRIIFTNQTRHFRKTGTTLLPAPLIVRIAFFFFFWLVGSHFLSILSTSRSPYRRF